jgi:hypothetical protein
MNHTESNLLDRYLQAIGQYLPAETRQDTLAELRANLEATIEAREEASATPLTEAEIAAILQAHGRPILVAARYLPQRSLIGPTLYPAFLFTLRKAGPIVLLVYFITRAILLIFAPTPLTFTSVIVTTFARLIPVLLSFWSIVTVIFATIEFAHTHKGEPQSWNTWDPLKLPPLASTPKKSLASRIADLVVHTLFTLYVFAIPYHPWLALGPGVTWLQHLSIAFAPAWRLFFIAFLILQLAVFLLKVLAFIPNHDRLKSQLELFVKFFGIGPTLMLAFSPTYFIPNSPTTDLRTLAAVNAWMNLSIRIALFFVILDFAIQLWKYLRKTLPTHRLAF